MRAVTKAFMSHNDGDDNLSSLYSFSVYTHQLWLFHFNTFQFLSFLFLLFPLRKLSINIGYIIHSSSVDRNESKSRRSGNFYISLKNMFLSFIIYTHTEVMFTVNLPPLFGPTPDISLL